MLALLYKIFFLCVCVMKNTQEAQIGTLVKQTRDENLTFLYFNYFFNARSYSYCSLSPILISRQSVIMRLNRFYSLKRHEKHPWDVSIKLKLALLWMIYWCILFQRKKKTVYNLQSKCNCLPAPPLKQPSFLAVFTHSFCLNPSPPLHLTSIL